MKLCGIKCWGTEICHNSHADAQVREPPPACAQGWGITPRYRKDYSLFASLSSCSEWVSPGCWRRPQALLRAMLFWFPPWSTWLPFSADFRHLTYANSKAEGNELQTVPCRFPQSLFTSVLVWLPCQLQPSWLSCPVCCNYTPYCHQDTHRVQGEPFICIAMVTVPLLPQGG